MPTRTLPWMADTELSVPRMLRLQACGGGAISRPTSKADAKRRHLARLVR